MVWYGIDVPSVSYIWASGDAGGTDALPLVLCVHGRVPLMLVVSTKNDMAAREAGVESIHFLLDLTGCPTGGSAKQNKQLHV